VKQVSLSGRIIGTVIVCQLVLTGALTAASVLYARVELRRAFDAALLGRAASTLALVRYTEDTPPDLLFDTSLLPPPSDTVQKDMFEIRKPNGQVVAQSEGVLPLGLEDDSDQYRDFDLGGVPYRAVTLRNVVVLDDEDDATPPRLRVTVTYASSLAEMHRHLTELGFYVGGTSLLLLMLASGVAAWGVGRRLEPLRALADSASVISASNWNFRPPDEAVSVAELAPLSAAIEAVLQRLRLAFQQQRDFTSDAAHELKTSVAIVKSSVQSLLQKPRSAQEYQEGLADILEDCGRLEELLARMLRLARIEQVAENGGMRRCGTTELTSTCEAAISRMQALARQRNIELELVNPTAVHLNADPEDLELIWVNLLENAVQYSPAGSKVTVRIDRDASPVVRILVEDSGPGIPPEELPYIFERFRRGDPSRARSTGGFGLGLAICKALVTALGGRIEAANRPGSGTRVCVQLPAVAS
jgi:signal transduction histidine kinase